MTYSCAIFSRGATTLEEAQEAKLELVCTKLGLEPGQRVLDVGCGWGSFAIHAAERHGVEVVGITLSEPQADEARRRVRERGLEDRVEIRVADYRELEPASFDAIASIGMVEHVGSNQIDVYARRLGSRAAAGRPAAQPRHRPRAGGRSRGGRLLRALRVPRRRSAASVPHRARAGARRPQDRSRGGIPGGLRRDAEPLAAAPGRRPDDAVRLAGEERVRVWRLYLRTARQGFRSGFLSVYQVRCEAPE